MKLLFIVAIAALISQLTACGQSNSPSTSAAPTATVAAPAEPATLEAAPVVADPVAGSPTPPAESHGN